MESFGDHGVVNMRAGVTDEFGGVLYNISSPPAVYKNLLIVGPAVQEGPSQGPSGDPRAFDARTGRLVWRLRTVPQPGEPGNDSWGPHGFERRSGPSQWGGITVDPERGLAVIPIGNPSDSFYGADRKGMNRHANSASPWTPRRGRCGGHFSSFTMTSSTSMSPHRRRSSTRR